MRVLIAFTVMIGIQILLLMSQLSTNQMAAEIGVTTPSSFSPVETEFIKHFDQTPGNYNLTNYNYSSDLPVIPDSTVSTIISVLIFPIQIIINWLETAFWAIYVFFATIPSLLTAMGVPSVFAFLIGVLYDGVAMMMLVYLFVK